MNKTLFIASLVAVLGTADISHAQNEVKVYSAPEIIMQSTMLDQDYERCINNSNCPVQDRLRIMIEMSEKGTETLEQINRNCEDMNYANCIGIQAEMRKRWRKFHTRTDNMMNSIDPYYQEESAQSRDYDMRSIGRTMGRKEPAAGYRQEDRRGWWDRLWNDREEPATQNE